MAGAASCTSNTQPSTVAADLEDPSLSRRGESERAAARRMEAKKSRGLLAHAIAHHDVNNIDKEMAREASICVTNEVDGSAMGGAAGGPLNERRI